MNNNMMELTLEEMNAAQGGFSLRGMLSGMFTGAASGTFGGFMIGGPAGAAVGFLAGGAAGAVVGGFVDDD